MESNNKYISVTYRLYTTENGQTEMVEEATEEQPFMFVTGFGLTIEGFENGLAALESGAEFDIHLNKEEAFGEHFDERVVDLDREIFSINGHFDHENIFEGAVVPLQNEDGNHFFGKVLKIAEDKVRMDLNHPLAGKELNFKGKVLESREATNEEIQTIINGMSGHCGCGCDHGHGDDCDCGHHHHDGECGCGHDHGEGGHHHHHDGECGCGHCH